MKYRLLPLLIIASLSQAKGFHGKDSRYHEMQHGFILSNEDTLGSHLVASGHHSRQTEIVGELVILDAKEDEYYLQRKEESTINQSYFLFQAQNLDLPTLKDGQVLRGHIIESKVGTYQPQNTIVKEAKFMVKKVLLNIANPFFLNGVGAHKLTVFTVDNLTNNKNGCRVISKPKDGICWKCTTPPYRRCEYL